MPLCQSPFISPCVSPDGFKLCSSPSMKSFSDINDWNSDYAKEIRKGLLKEEPVDVCKECLSVRPGLGAGGVAVEYEQEEVPIGFKSLRIARSNKCDYACKMCSSDISHTYDKTYNEGKVGVIENNYDLTPHLDEVEFLAVSGGNPVLDKKLLPIIKKVMDNGVINNIIFTSNGSSFPLPFLELFSNTKVRSSLLFSIDGPKELNECLRKGVIQERFYATVNKVGKALVHNPNVSICLETTLTSQNLKHLISLYREVEKNVPINAINFWINPCVYPEEFSLNNLTQDDLDFVKKRLIPFFEFENTNASTQILNCLKGIRNLK